jgi:hypothetical protein
MRAWQDSNLQHTAPETVKTNLGFQAMLISVRISLIPPERYYTDGLSQPVR